MIIQKISHLFECQMLLNKVKIKTKRRKSDNRSRKTEKRRKRPDEELTIKTNERILSKRKSNRHRIP